MMPYCYPQDLIAGLNNGDEKALDCVYATWNERLVLYAERLTGDKMEGEDIAIDSIRKAWERKEFSDESHLVRFLFKCTRNSSLNLKEKIKRKNINERDAFFYLHSIEDEDQETLELDRLGKIHEIVKELPSAQRRAFELRYYHRYKFKKIALLLNRAETTVHTQCTNAVKFIRNRLGANLVLVLFAACICLSYLHFKYGKKNRPDITNSQKVIVPAQNKVVLQLASGKKIFVEDVPDGTVIKQENIEIKKEKGCLINTELFPVANSTSSTLNTLMVPRGNKFRVTLGDGTKVWLSPGSEIKYPPTFSTLERSVCLKGEAYFEVTHNRSKPFKVITNGVEVTVLGTKFLVSAYQDDSTINTTLLEGRVVVSVNGSTRPVILKPGQRAIVSRVNSKFQVTAIEKVNNWHNSWNEDDFYFYNEDVTAIMKQIGRYYNKEVVFAGTCSPRKYDALIYREKNIDNILATLNFCGIQVTRKGDTLVVLPQ